MYPPPKAFTPSQNKNGFIEAKKSDLIFSPTVSHKQMRTPDRRPSKYMVYYASRERRVYEDEKGSMWFEFKGKKITLIFK